MTDEYHINFKGFREVFRTPTISKGAKLVLVDLLLYAGTNAECFPSQAELAKNHHYTPRQIGNLLKELKQFHLIDWERGGFGRSNRYVINEEIYFPTDVSNSSDRQPSSYNIGNSIPLPISKPFPTNVVTESNNYKGSQTHKRISKSKAKPFFKPCGLNGCDNGYLFLDSQNPSYCKCREDFNEQLKEYEQRGVL